MKNIEKLFLQHTKQNLLYMLDNTKSIDLLRVRNIAHLLIQEIDNMINKPIQNNENRAEK